MQDDNELAGMIPGGIPIAEALEVFGKLMDYAREAEITKRDIAKYDAIRDVMITDITTRYQFYHELLVRTFRERNKVIEKNFEIIEKGIRENDHALINMGLKSVTDIVKESPFRNIQTIASIQERHNLLESGGLSVE